VARRHINPCYQSVLSSLKAVADEHNHAFRAYVARAMASSALAPLGDRLTDEQAAALLAPDVRWDINSLDGANESFSLSDTMYFPTSADGAELGMVLGFRQYNTALPDPGFVGKVRIYKTYEAVKDKLNKKQYQNYRDQAIYRDHPGVFKPEQEVFATDEFMIVTQKQMEEGVKVMVLEPKRAARVLGKTYHRRYFDKELDLAKLERVDDGEWCYCARYLTYIFPHPPVARFLRPCVACRANCCSSVPPCAGKSTRPGGSGSWTTR
jgi:hypothetical protein